MLVVSEGEAPVDADLILVHGLRGHRLHTWTEKGVFWPGDILPGKLAHTRIMTWGYDADVMTFFPGGGNTSQSSIFQHAKSLLEDIQDERAEQDERERPVIFLAHSLGGLVVKDALCMAHNERFRTHNPRGAAVGASTVGVIFAGTPHRGSNSAVWASIANNVAKYALNDQNDKVVDALRRGSETLERLQYNFSPILPDLKVFTLLEDHRYSKAGKVVDDDSATLGSVNERQRTIPADHIGMRYRSSTSSLNLTNISIVKLSVILHCKQSDNNSLHKAQGRGSTMRATSRLLPAAQRAAFPTSSLRMSFRTGSRASALRQPARPHARFQSTAPSPASPAEAQTLLQRLWNSPVGVKTVHFWAPVMKWALVLAGVSDFYRPAEKLSLTQNVALLCTGAIWTRWCLIIKPKNYLLAAVNFFLACVGSVQVGRIVTYQRRTPAAAAGEQLDAVTGKAEGVAAEAEAAVKRV
ncbi:MAG: hypothetical protein M1832_002475 [Thelocarpon impressellum]|nr:MAG: hypothetical protein M1832_002475 [Thelocarpon impressellum]